MTNHVLNSLLHNNHNGGLYDRIIYHLFTICMRNIITRLPRIPTLVSKQDIYHIVHWILALILALIVPPAFVFLIIYIHNNWKL